jgi:hypothetical protein
VAVSFISGGNQTTRRKQSTGRKSLRKPDYPKKTIDLTQVTEETRLPEENHRPAASHWGNQTTRRKPSTCRKSLRKPDYPKKAIDLPQVTEETRLPEESHRPAASHWGNQTTRRKPSTCRKSLRKPDYPTKTIGLSQVTDKLYHTILYFSPRLIYKFLGDLCTSWWSIQFFPPLEYNNYYTDVEI